MAVAVAGEDYPAEGGDGGANERTYHHDPEIGTCFGAPEGGTEGAGGIDGAVVDGDPYDVDQAEGEVDGQSGKFANPLRASVAPSTTRTKQRPMPRTPILG